VTRRRVAVKWERACWWARMHGYMVWLGDAFWPVMEAASMQLDGFACEDLP
jgi:hypothetical protein